MSRLVALVCLLTLAGCAKNSSDVNDASKIRSTRDEHCDWSAVPNFCGVTVETRGQRVVVVGPHCSIFGANVGSKRTLLRGPDGVADAAPKGTEVKVTSCAIFPDLVHPVDDDQAVRVHIEPKD